MTLTYESYLQLNRLLQLQQPQSAPPEHDEMLFIIVHQTYELWFRLLLHELEKICRDFNNGQLFEVIHTWQRCRTVLKTLVAQIDIVETMTPMSFASFRDRLESASGFQSVQFRELEFLLGFKRADMLRYAPTGDNRTPHLRQRLQDHSVVDFFHQFLRSQGANIPDDVLQRDTSLPPQPSSQVQDEILRLYTERGEMAILFELMTDFDEGLQEWRYRHIKLVERTIGNKQGTGGSFGVEFLKQSLFHPLFADLWEIRHRR